MCNQFDLINADNAVEKRLHHLMMLVRQTLPSMHPAGRPIVAGGLVGTLLLRRLWRPLGPVGLILTGLCAWFFREPERTAPSRPGVLVAPADGKIVRIERASTPVELGIGDQQMLRISIFLTIFDVHVQRLPATGEIRRIAYRAGSFLSADLDKASDQNERNSVLLNVEGRDVVVVQIAGLVARRIVCAVAEGQWSEAGRTYGLIRFGSRVDTYVPVGSRILVECGQRTIGGETVLAELAGDEVGRDTED